MYRKWQEISTIEEYSTDAAKIQKGMSKATFQTSLQAVNNFDCNTPFPEFGTGSLLLQYGTFSLILHIHLQHNLCIFLQKINSHNQRISHRAVSAKTVTHMHRNSSTQTWMSPQILQYQMQEHSHQEPVSEHVKKAANGKPKRNQQRRPRKEKTPPASNNLFCPYYRLCMLLGNGLIFSILFF